MSQTGEALLREMERKANDECLVINPTSEDFFINWDGYRFTVPNTNTDKGYGKGKLVVPRYIAKYYIKHMTDKLINQEYDAHIDKYKKEYAKKDEYFGAREEQIGLRTNDKKLREKHFKTLWGGVVRKFGVDEIPETQRPAPVDRRSITDQLMDQMDGPADDFLAQIEEQDDKS